MAVRFDTPVSAIEGIGPRTEQLFNQRGVYTVSDLLRAPSTALHRAVVSVASLPEVKSWRQMAVLLEVYGVTPQLSEALVKSGIFTVSDLRLLSLDELDVLFRDAETRGVIPQMPSKGEMAEILKDSTALEYSGAVTGTVKNRQGQPIAGATIGIARRDAVTDARGRFRICRIHRDDSVRLTISANAYRTLTQNVTPMPTSVVSVIQFMMVPEAGTAPQSSEARSSLAILSELNGDSLAHLGRAEVTSHEVSLASLRQHDLLKLTETYANETDVKLVSKLMEYDGTKVMVHWARVPKSQLPEGCGVGDHYVMTSTGFREVKMTDSKLTDYKRLLKARRGLPANSLQTPQERNGYVARLFRLLKEMPR